MINIEDGANKVRHTEVLQKRFVDNSLVVADIFSDMYTALSNIEDVDSFLSREPAQASSIVRDVIDSKLDGVDIPVWIKEQLNKGVDIYQRNFSQIKHYWETVGGKKEEVLKELLPWFSFKDIDEVKFSFTVFGLVVFVPKDNLGGIGSGLFSAQAYDAEEGGFYCLVKVDDISNISRHEWQIANHEFLHLFQSSWMLNDRNNHFDAEKSNHFFHIIQSYFQSRSVAICIEKAAWLVSDGYFDIHPEAYISNLGDPFDLVNSWIAEVQALDRKSYVDMTKDLYHQQMDFERKLSWVFLKLFDLFKDRGLYFFVALANQIDKKNLILFAKHFGVSIDEFDDEYHSYVESSQEEFDNSVDELFPDDGNNIIIGEDQDDEQYSRFLLVLVEIRLHHPTNAITSLLKIIDNLSEKSNHYNYILYETVLAISQILDFDPNGISHAQKLDIHQTLSSLVRKLQSEKGVLKLSLVILDRLNGINALGREEQSIVLVSNVSDIRETYRIINKKVNPEHAAGVEFVYWLMSNDTDFDKIKKDKEEFSTQFGNYIREKMREILTYNFKQSPRTKLKVHTAYFAECLRDSYTRFNHQIDRSQVSVDMSLRWSSSTLVLKYEGIEVHRFSLKV